MDSEERIAALADRFNPIWPEGTAKREEVRIAIMNAIRHAFSRPDGWIDGKLKAGKVITTVKPTVGNPTAIYLHPAERSVSEDYNAGFAADVSVILQAATMLEGEATCIRECHTMPPLFQDWGNEERAHKEHDAMLSVASGLREIARRSPPQPAKGKP